MSSVGTYKVGVEITDTPENVQKLGNLIQFAAANVDNQDMIKLLSKVKGDPKIVRKALKWV